MEWLGSVGSAGAARALLLSCLVAVAAAPTEARAGRFQGGVGEVPGELSLERLSRELRSASAIAQAALAHVEVRLDADRNLHASGVVVESEELLVAVPYHPGFQTRERAFVRLLGPRRACLGYFVGASPDRSASFVRLQVDESTRLGLTALADAPDAALEAGSFAIAVAPTSALDERGQPELALWSTLLSARAQSYRERHGLFRLQDALGPLAHGALVVDPRGRAIGFVPDLEPRDAPESADTALAPLAPRAPAAAAAAMAAPEAAPGAHVLPIARLRAEARAAHAAFASANAAAPGWPPQPWIGVYIWRPELGMEREEAPFAPFQVLAVFEGSPAQRAGLREGDVLTAINGVGLASSSDFVKGLSRIASQPPHLLRMNVRRGELALELVAELNPAPGISPSVPPHKKGD